MCDAKNPPDSDFVSVSALILFILYILVITWDLLYRLWMSWKYEYQPGRCTILGNACNCHFSLGIFIFLIKITPIGGFEQFTAGLVLSLVPELLTGAWVHSTPCAILLQVWWHFCTCNFASLMWLLPSLFYTAF